MLQLAERVLAVAPQHGEARKARARAWKSQEPETIAEARGGHSLDSTAKDENVGPPKRFLLWIDGVGGYLVCLGSRLTLRPGDRPRAAWTCRCWPTCRDCTPRLARDGEGYVIEAVRPLQVNGKPVRKAALHARRPGDAGRGVPVPVPACRCPVSTTARLDLVSGHRLPLSVDGILLMAETLVIGHGPQAPCAARPTLKQVDRPVPHKDGLGVRLPGRVQGQRTSRRRIARYCRRTQR